MGEATLSKWKATEIGQVTSKIEGGGTPSRKKTDYWNGAIPWATVKDLKAVYLSTTEEYISEEGLNNSSSKLIPKDTVIIASRMAVGKAVVFSKDVSINQDLKAVHLNSTIDSKFFLQWYLSKAETLASIATGSTVKGIRLDELEVIPLSLPPLPEQKKIATILTSVDTVIEKTQAQIDKLNDLKTGMMQELLTKGIGHSNFKPLGNWRTGRIADISQIPETWELVELGEVAKLETGHTPSRDVKEYWGGSIQWLSLHDTKQLNTHTVFSTKLTITEEGIDNSSARLLPAGTVALSRTASVGNCVLFGQEMATSQDFANYVCGEKLEPAYLLHMFKWMQHVWTRLAEGSTHKTIYMPVFKRLQILLPPLEEQKKIADSATIINHKIRKLTEKHNSLSHIKKALMQDLLTGKVRVTPDPE